MKAFPLLARALPWLNVSLLIVLQLKVEVNLHQHQLDMGLTQIRIASPLSSLSFFFLGSLADFYRITPESPEQQSRFLPLLLEGLCVKLFAQGQILTDVSGSWIQTETSVLGINIAGGVLSFADINHLQVVYNDTHPPRWHEYLWGTQQGRTENKSIFEIPKLRVTILAALCLLG